MIEISNLTMRYPNGRGIFDVNFSVNRGEVTGFLGPNGAGKTTAIRCLLGYLRGTGDCKINGRDCFSDAPEIAKTLGFIAGEPVFPDGMGGREYLDYLCALRGDREKLRARVNELCAYFELNPAGKIKRMSKGMKQKIAIIAAFMHSPDIYILDEPTSGLDPIMQSKFIDLILAEKQNGKTILMSSHIFAEIQRAADSVVIIKNGRIVAHENISVLKNKQKRVYIVETAAGVAEHIVPQPEIDAFVKRISKQKILNLTTQETTLESIFMDYYATEQKEDAK